MILVVTNCRDVTSDFIVLELQRRGLSYFRLNTERLAAAQVSFSGRSFDWSLTAEGRSLSTREVKAAYFRRPGIPVVSEDIGDIGERDYCAAEWGAVLRSLYSHLEGRWLNAPWAIFRAEDKPLQLERAAAIGFDIPETVVTNEYRVARALADRVGTIVKPLRKALVEGERVIFTSRWGAQSASDPRAWAVAPVIVQQEVRKLADIRVTVVGDTVFAAAIDSQVHAETEVDWRRGANPALAHERIGLPQDISQRCCALVKSLDLRFGAIDLVQDLDGRFWFLEINPNGQWAWIQQRTGLPIAAAIVDTLVEIAT